MKPQDANPDRHTESESSDAELAQRFERTVEQMLEMPPKPHDEMKMGAARKSDTRSSGKEAKG